MRLIHAARPLFKSRHPWGRRSLTLRSGLVGPANEHSDVRRTLPLSVVLLLTVAGAVSAHAPAPIRPDQAAFRELFEELIRYTLHDRGSS